MTVEIREAYATRESQTRSRDQRPSEEHASSDQLGQPSADTDGQVNDQGQEGSDMAEQTQQQSGSDNQSVDLSQQITEAIQPVMEDLQQQITQTVQQQLQQVSGAVSSNGSGTLSLDNLGSIGESLQSSLDSAVESLQPFFQWLMEKVQQLVNWIMGMFMGGSSSGSEGSEQQEASQ